MIDASLAPTPSATTTDGMGKGFRKANTADAATILSNLLTDSGKTSHSCSHAVSHDAKTSFPIAS